MVEAQRGIKDKIWSLTDGKRLLLLEFQWHFSEQNTVHSASQMPEDFPSYLVDMSRSSFQMLERRNFQRPLIWWSKFIATFQNRLDARVRMESQSRSLSSHSNGNYTFGVASRMN